MTAPLTRSPGPQVSSNVRVIKGTLVGVPSRPEPPSPPPAAKGRAKGGRGGGDTAASDQAPKSEREEGW